MIQHVVMWKFKEEPGKTKQEVIRKIKESLEALVDKIDVLQKLEVREGFDGYDAWLYSELPDRESLRRYLDHPEHLKAAAYVRQMTAERAYIDCEA